MRKFLAGLRIGLVGGDKRLEYYLPSLIAAGARLYGVGLDLLAGYPEIIRCELDRAVRECHVLILPMQGCDAQGQVNSSYSANPVSLGGAGLSRKALLVMSGIAQHKLKEISVKNEWHLVEIAEDDELAILNSIPTAEGAVRLAQERAVTTIHSSKVVVLGFGRCGLTLGRLLNNMGAIVYAAARKRSDLARAVSLGLTPVSMQGVTEYLGNVDFVFNTIPHLVLGREQLSLTKSDVVIVDIASAPGGVDFIAAQELKRTAVLAPGIPGKFTPQTAGLVLGRVLPRLIIENLPEER